MEALEKVVVGESEIYTCVYNKWQKFIKITSVGMGAAKSNETR